MNIIILIAWMAAIFLGSSTQQADIPSAVRPLGKVLHVLEYAVLGFLAMPLAYWWRSPLLVAVIFCVAYAVSDEFHQLFVPGRNGSPIDVLIDSCGSIIGSYSAWRVLR
jgi:VanZ family protein